MRTIAAAMLALALPAAAQAQFTAEAPRDTGYYRIPPTSGRTTSGDARVDRKLERAASDTGRRPDGDTALRSHLYNERDLRRARGDIERRRDSGELTRSEAKQLRREVRRIEEMSRRYGRDGLTDYERRELELRTSELRNRTATGRTS